ncbi:MarR family winged helix-turn-helix transcriptional regulator [Consotaella salsifontis]|uniref:Transcriptional regulator, MarR family n=1 Tax=Consotaella salsifontis TaxID=1365950 RepID=A0A1T4MAR9_9HYPH|nr:MarR family transcriptional regulator [Consotaella salsifontis]SJZ64140.1 transcriptional regulator, MarR family [Consotaella salsifontis]
MEETLEREIAFLARNLEALYRRRAYPMERAHYLLLLRLTDGPQSIGELAAGLSLDSSTVTRQVAAMQRQLLIKRRANPADGRSSLIEATGKGRTAAETMRKDRIQRVEELVGQWSAEDGADLARLLTKLNESLGQRLALLTAED